MCGSVHLHHSLKESLCVCVCVFRHIEDTADPGAMCAYALALVHECVSSLCVSHPLWAWAQGHSWPLARNKQLEYSWAVASTSSSSSSSSWQDLGVACLWLAFTLPPTGLHCFYWHNLASIGFFCTRWLVVVFYCPACLFILVVFLLLTWYYIIVLH